MIQFSIFSTFAYKFPEPFALCASEEQQINEPKIMPSINEVVHFENDSYIVTCDGGVGTRVRWFSPKNVWVDPRKRGTNVHVEEKNFESALIFTSITLDDKGNWTCEAENNPQRVGFNMIVYSKSDCYFVVNKFDLIYMDIVLFHLFSRTNFISRSAKRSKC